MKMIKWLTLSAVVSLFAACGGGGSSAGSSSFGSGGGGTGGGTGTSAKPTITVSLSTTTVTTATPATVTATVKDSTGAAVPGQVVTFSAAGQLGSFSVTTALTDSSGVATTTLNASAATQSGADSVVASVTIDGTTVTASTGFQLTAPTVSISSVTADTTTLGAYGQTGVQVKLAGTVAGTPSTVAITSSCIASGKAVLTPATASTTTGVANFTYKDNGCGATGGGGSDTLRASVTGTAATGSLALTLASPVANSINFVSATPGAIYLKGSGFGETSTIVFKVLDSAGNGLPNQNVLLKPTTLAGGLTLSGTRSDGTITSDSNGNVSVIINSGTVPTPVRVTASLVATPAITTVSSTLAIAVGLPSQLNFSFSQATRNIEAYNIDGTTNTYTIIASDRLGNPVPAGTAINFVTEGGQIEAIKNTTINASGIASATANFVSSSPRPTDGRVTVLAYALGEESFIDQNGNNVWDTGEPFQDLGSIYLDRYFNGHYNRATDQFISLSLPGSTTAACATTANSLLALDVSIPSIPSTDSTYSGFQPPSSPTSCDGTWGKAYVRRAIETVFSTSSARPLWLSPPPSSTIPACTTLTIGTGGYNPDESKNRQTYYSVAGTTLFNAAGTYALLVADANPERLNPMAAGTTVTGAGTQGITVTILGGSPVPSTADATFTAFSVAFASGTTAGTVTLSFKSPSGLTTSVNIGVTTASGGTSPPASSTCP